MRFVSIAFLCILAGCSGRSEQPKLTYIPFAGQGQSAVHVMSVQNNGASAQNGVMPVQGSVTVPQTCQCMCPAGGSVAATPVMTTPVPSAVQKTQKTPTDYLLPEENYYPTQPSVIEAPIQGSDSIVILQHAVQRDLVKCSASDLRCISGYEMQGYVQLSQTPSVPVSVEQKYDVLDGKWSDSSNVPRW